MASPEEGGTSNFYMLEVLCNQEVFRENTKSALIDNLRKVGLPVLGEDIIKHPIYMNPSLRDFTEECSVAETAYKRLIVLGHFMHSTLLDADMDNLSIAVSLFCSAVGDTVGNDAVN